MRPRIDTFFSPSVATSVANLPKPVLPVSATVGGVPAIILFAGQTAGSFGVTQINLLVPDSLEPGVYPVVVTVNGSASTPAQLTVQ